ncbi:hypothetical protein GOC80_13310 [Sinorhizobium medicae]|nr:hypothetical protein [Sinorhizobium medicae]
MIAEVNLSASINGLLTPFRSVPTALQRFCVPLFFHREDDVYDLAYSGSSLLFRHRGRNFQLATKHQLRAGNDTFSPADVCLLVEGERGHVGLSPNGASRVKVEGDDLLPQDIVLLEYENSRGEHNLQPRFLQLDLDQTRALSEVEADSIRLLFTIGYPTKSQGYEPDFDEDFNAISLRVISRLAKLIFDEHKIRPSYEESRTSITVSERYQGDIGDPDGWSGAPVFFLWGDDKREHHLGFAGMITHANSAGSFMIYRAEGIRAFVNGAIDTPYPAATERVTDAGLGVQ